MFLLLKKKTSSLFKNARKSIYLKDKVLLKIYKKLDKKLINETDAIPTYTPFVEEKKILIDQHYLIRSTFDLLHADIANNKFFTRSAVDLLYCLIFIDLFTSKTNTYLM